VFSYLTDDETCHHAQFAYSTRHRSTRHRHTRSSSRSAKSEDARTESTKRWEKKESEIAGGEKAVNKRCKRRKQSLGEVAVSADTDTTSPGRRRRSADVVGQDVLEDRVQIQIRALARYNHLLRSLSHSMAEREA
jgi:hypothetical protein